MHSNRTFEADLGDVLKSTYGPPPRHASITTDFNNFRGHTPENVRKSENSADKKSENASKFKACCRKFSSLMLSHLGCFIIVIVYVIAGGCLFNYLEAGNEISGCSQVQRRYQEKLFQTVDLVYTVSQGTNATQALTTVLETLQEFSGFVYSINVDPHTNCSGYQDGSLLPSWNIVNAAYFCVTIVTTIGYGHIAPTTQWGQIVCIVYGIIGIPLMLLFLSKIGEPTALMFRTFYLNICCFKCFIKKIPRESQAQHHSEWTEEDGIASRPPPAKVVEVIEDDEDEEDEDQLVNIPIMVTIMLLGFYVIIGAAVFRVWEPWTLVEGAYFSFITLTTIGFGDYVPGRFGPFNSSWIITELTIGCIYCLFGLALLSMCVNLIQDEISAKFRWISAKCGISKAREDEEDEEDDEDEEDADDDDDEEETDREEISDGDLGRNSRSKQPTAPPRSNSSGRQVESHA